MIRVRAPATTANLGPGFDCAAVAFDLWNELEVVADGGEPDRDDLSVKAFALLADPAGHTFTSTDRIPRERGLGSSAAAVAAGLVAGAITAGRELNAEQLLALGIDLEGHADNLAAALAGGVCLTWDLRIARVADAPPAAAIALIPVARQRTDQARAALPDVVPHGDAVFSAGRAAVLGVALAAGSEELFAAGTEDRLHEPYRAAGAPLLRAVRDDLPAGALAVTLSGSGPTVIVWARREQEDECLADLARRDLGAAVVPLRPSAEGVSGTRSEP